MDSNPLDFYLDSPELEAGLINDDGSAAKQHLAAGRPIYYADDRYQEGVVKKYPDGRKQLVTIDAERRVTVIREL